MELTKEYLHKIFDYKDGELFWKIKPNRRIKIGSKAGSSMPNGYKNISINKKFYYLHRIIFLYHHGYFPEEVDHIKGKSNKIENLRAANRCNQSCNTKLRKDNKSGIKGVYWNKRDKKWAVQLHFDNVKKYFGSYFDINVARFISETMRHKYHGKFSNKG